MHVVTKIKLAPEPRRRGAGFKKILDLVDTFPIVIVSHYIMNHLRDTMLP